MKTLDYAFADQLCDYYECKNRGNVEKCSECEVVLSHNENFDQWNSASCKIIENPTMLDK